MQSITITPEDSSDEHCVSIAVSPDENVEDSEVFLVSLSSTDTAVQVAQSSSTVVIADDPPST